MRKIWLAGWSLLMIPFATACTTHMRTSPEATQGAALQGAAYRLPMLQYDISFDDTIVSCPVPFKHEGATYWLGDLGLSRKATAVSSYVAGERYAIDHAALTSLMKTSKYGFDSYESGVLKSINTGAEDQTGPLLKSVVSVALSAYGLAVPVAPAASGSLGPNFKSMMRDRTKNLQTSVFAIERNTASREHHQSAIEKLLHRASAMTAATCKPEVAASLIASNATDDYEVASATLADTNAEIDALKLALVSRAAANDDIKRLVAAAMRQSAEARTVEKLKADADKAKAVITIKQNERWVPGSDQWVTTYKPNLRQKIEDQLGRFIGKKVVLEWWAELSVIEREAIKRDYVHLVEAFGLKVGETPACKECPEPMSLTAFQEATSARFAMVGDRPAGVAAASLPSRKHGRIEGIVVREPLPLRLATCTKLKAGTACDAKSASILSADILVPQAGAFRVLPFKNGPFEAATLSAKFQETGRMESFSYERTKAMSSGVDSLADGLAKVEAFREKRDKQATDLRASDRAEQLAAVNHDIALLTKEKELTALQSPPSPTEQELIAAETARLNAEIALLNAKRTRLEAEALLIAAANK